MQPGNVLWLIHSQAWCLLDLGIAAQSGAAQAAVPLCLTSERAKAQFADLSKWHDMLRNIVCVCYFEHLHGLVQDKR
jgi:hypothetical protein